MKICPSCGTIAVDTAVVCDADGTPLETGNTATTLPVRRVSGTWCLSCGSRDGDDGAGTCIRCGNRYGRPRSLAPGAPGSRLLDLVLVRPHGEGDVVVLDPMGSTGLLVFGPKAAIAAEASALRAPAVTVVPGHVMFPTVVRDGHALEVGHFALLPFTVEGGKPATPLLEAELSFEQGITLIGQALDAASQLEARGYAWEPWPTDLYLREGELVVVRARGARKLREGEPLDAKRVLEALAGALLPEPFSRSTPTMVRLLLPRWNFSTPEARTIQEARIDLAEVVSLARDAGSKDASKAAALSDPGLRRAHHEDATALTLGDAGGSPFAVLVVCDGVSSSSHADAASRIAAAVSRDSLAHFARQSLATAKPEEVTRAVTQAIRDGHVAICTAGIEYGAGAPPATTIVTALVYRQRLTVGWVGDSRAYWVSSEGSAQCTIDHSWLNDMVGRGILTEVEALTSPLAHALTRCLGPIHGDGGSADSTPDVRTWDLVGPGRLILCTDGLWNYFPSVETIATMVDEASLPGHVAHAEALARFLVCRALADGGGDNVSVVVLDVG